MMNNMYVANGKLLISGEYLVIKGATALAFPVRFNQTMKVIKTTQQKNPKMYWNAEDNGNAWFKAVFDLPGFEIKDTNQFETAESLRKVFVTSALLNSQFPVKGYSFNINTGTNFPSVWGLGTSSAMLVNIAKWANVDPFSLFFSINAGSGFDIACAMSDTPILYRLEGSKPVIENTEFSKEYSSSLYFVFLGKKQNTGDSIWQFLNNYIPDDELIVKIDKITSDIVNSVTLEEFEEAIRKHEQLISGLLKDTPVKVRYFQDFQGEIKSLGAWGGDFILVTWRNSYESLKDYFRRKNLDTVIPFKEMVL